MSRSEDFNSRMRRNHGVSKKEGFYFGMIYFETLELLSKLNLKTIEYKVMLYLCSLINNKDNMAAIKQTDLSRILILDKSNLSKALKTLREKQLIAKGNGGFMINPNILHIGQGRHEHIQLHSNFEKLVLEETERGLDFTDTIEFDYLTPR